MADARDSKSRGGNTVPVQVRPSAPVNFFSVMHGECMSSEASCIFCKIIAGSIPAAMIAQNDNVIVIKDIAPKAPIHYLIIPKKHVASIKSLDETTISIVSDCMLMAKQIATQDDQVLDFRLLENDGPGAGQSVFHLHFHFLAGKKMHDF